MSYTICKTSQPPTGVDHCLEAFVLPKLPRVDDSVIEGDTQLVVAKTSFLQVYRITKKKDDNGEYGNPRLELAYETKLFGNIQSLNTLKNANTEYDSVVLTFLDAKVSFPSNTAFGAHLITKKRLFPPNKVLIIV